MHIPKKYFQDRMVLLLLSVNVFITLLSSILILLRLDNGRIAVVARFEGVNENAAIEVLSARDTAEILEVHVEGEHGGSKI